MLGMSDDFEEAGRKRPGRRWIRRARLVAPFVSLPLLFGALLLSIDLIEYRPVREPSRLLERSIAGAKMKTDAPFSTETAISISAIRTPDLEADALAGPDNEVSGPDRRAAAGPSSPRPRP